MKTKEGFFCQTENLPATLKPRPYPVEFHRLQVLPELSINRESSVPYPSDAQI